MQPCVRIQPAQIETYPNFMVGNWNVAYFRATSLTTRSYAYTFILTTGTLECGRTTVVVPAGATVSVVIPIFINYSLGSIPYCINVYAHGKLLSAPTVTGTMEISPRPAEPIGPQLTLSSIGDYGRCVQIGQYYTGGFRVQAGPIYGVSLREKVWLDDTLVGDYNVGYLDPYREASLSICVPSIPAGFHAIRVNVSGIQTHGFTVFGSPDVGWSSPGRPSWVVTVASDRWVRWDMSAWAPAEYTHTFKLYIDGVQVAVTQSTSNADFNGRAAFLWQAPKTGTYEWQVEDAAGSVTVP